MGSGKHLVAVISLAFISVTSYYYLKRRKKEVNNDIYEVIMFSEKDVELRKSKYSRCMITVSMERILFYVNKPRQSLDLCMYVLTNQDLTNILMKLNFRGVKIRIIIDSVMAYSQGSPIKRLEKQGIEVRWIKTPNFMHHKFCLIDPEGELPIVMTGSLNWTSQAMFGNYENVIVTSQKVIVDNYKQEFERLWVLFKPVV